METITTVEHIGTNGNAMEDIESIIGKSTEELSRELLQVIVVQGWATNEELLPLFANDGITLRRVLQRLKALKAITNKVITDVDGATKSVWQFMNPDRYRGKSIDFIMEELFGSKEKGKRYDKYMVTRIGIVLMRPALAGIPGTEDNTLVFRRIDEGNGERVWLLHGYFRAMMRDASRFVPGLGTYARQALENKWVYFQDVTLDPSVLMPNKVLTIAPAGKGMTRHEAIPQGTEIDFDVLFPSSVLTEKQIRDVAMAAGQWIGFSPGKHVMGWGLFRVV